MPNTYRVLSLDGGGVHGLLTVRLLQQIEEASGFLQCVNVFAGTSAGAIIALVLASSRPNQRRQRLDDCARFFSNPELIDNTPIGYARALAGNAPLYSGVAWETGVRELLACGEKRLRDLHTKVLIPAFELDNHKHHPNWRPRIFHNFPDKQDSAIDPTDDEWFAHGGGDQFVDDVALRSSAAPMITPVYQGFVDGGIFANNPSMCAVALVQHDDDGNEGAEDIFDRMSLVSIGTGQKRGYMSSDPRRTDQWGWFKWLLDPDHPFALLDILFDCGTEVVDFQCRHLLGPDHYFRIDPPLGGSLARVDFPSPRTVGILDQAAESGHAQQRVVNLLEWFEKVAPDWLPSGQRSQR
jgi:uncharacterized protein